MDKKKIYFFIALILCVIVFLAISQSAKNLEPRNIRYVKIAGQNIEVDLAVTSRDQAQGLSGRESLMDGEGMLFVFPDQAPKFWMKDMNFPIDMIWLNKDMQVVYIKKDARPESFPDIFGPDQGAKYVLEVVSGFSDKNNLKIGDEVEMIL